MDDGDISGAVEFPDRTLLRFTGEDRLRYLNGQVTNDVAKASAGVATYACVTNAKGKLEADVFIREFGEDGYLLDGPAELREALGVRLERYIIADDVEMEDVTDDFVLFHVLGNLGGAEGEWEGISERFGKTGTDVIVAAAAANEMRDALAGGVGFVGEELLEGFRISRGIPVWGKELGPGLLPPEARVEARAIDYEKGCYIGQEVISRIRSAGKVNRLLSGLRGREGTFEVGDLLFSKGGDGAVVEVGKVTSAADLGGERIGLGYVKRAASEVGARLSCGIGENSLSSSVEITEIRRPPAD